MPGSLNLYRFVEDAWAGGVGDWCRAAPAFKARGIRSWLVLENAGQLRWLRRCFAPEALPGGLEAMRADGLRALLSRAAGIEPPLAHSATSAFLVKVAAHRHSGLEAAAVRRNPESLLEAAGPLLATGELPGFPRSLSKALANALVEGDASAAACDFRLREAAGGLPVRLCWLGWDASHGGDLGLIFSASQRAVSSDFFLPSPRLPAEAVQRAWIEKLEEALQLDRAVCAGSGFTSQNEALVSRLERSGLEAPDLPAMLPRLLVGREWGDQVRRVADEVSSWAPGRGEAALPLGIVAPAASATAVAVGELLAARGIQVERPGRIRELPAPLLIVEQIARYHLEGHDVEEFLELAHLLFAHGKKPWSALAPEEVSRAIDFAFSAAQSRNARILASALPRRSEPVWQIIRSLVETLGRWDDEASWPELRARWERLLDGLGLPSEVLEPLWGRTPILFGQGQVPARLFMEWIAAELVEMRGDCGAPDYSGNAPVVITTFAEAAQQTWGGLIFLDSNEHVWPDPFAENPFLKDAAKARLSRQQGVFLPTSRDRWLLDQAHFLDLLEHCAEGVAFAGTALAQPNEWVLRAVLAAGQSPLEAWAAAAAPVPCEPPPVLPETERAHFATVHRSRHDPLLPSDRYAFNLHESKIQPEAWSATRLDLAVTCPATFALLALFDAEPAGCFTRGEGQAVGSRAHRWLGRVLGGRDQLEPIQPGDYEKKLGQELAASRRELEEWYAAEGLPLPLWWESCLQKTAWATRRCFQELRPEISGAFCAMEQRLDVSVGTSAGPLLLKGRVDILLSDRPALAGASVRIFDFKTGRKAAPSLASLDRGEGHQFAAYYLMARDAGAASAAVGIIRPDEALRDVFGDAEETALRARFGRLAELQRNLRFERRGPLVAEYGRCEQLPMATVPIDPKVLEQKAGLVLLAE